MPDKKLTDSEIVKALECFRHRILNSRLAEKVTEREIMSIVNALDLINRLQAEIERLKKFALIRAFDRFEKETKSEAYKEFAALVKDKAYTYSDITGYQSTVVDVCEIDGVYEELVGDK